MSNRIANHLLPASKPAQKSTPRTAGSRIVRPAPAARPLSEAAQLRRLKRDICRYDPLLASALGLDLI